MGHSFLYARRGNKWEMLSYEAWTDERTAACHNKPVFWRAYKNERPIPWNYKCIIFGQIIFQNFHQFKALKMQHINYCSHAVQLTFKIDTRRGVVSWHSCLFYFVIFRCCFFLELDTIMCANWLIDWLLKVQQAIFQLYSGWEKFVNKKSERGDSGMFPWYKGSLRDNSFNRNFLYMRLS
jgi:hypothetical protein